MNLKDEFRQEIIKNTPIDICGRDDAIDKFLMKRHVAGLNKIWKYIVLMDRERTLPQLVSMSKTRMINNFWNQAMTYHSHKVAVKLFQLHSENISNERLASLLLRAISPERDAQSFKKFLQHIATSNAVPHFGSKISIYKISEKLEKTRQIGLYLQILSDFPVINLEKIEIDKNVLQKIIDNSDYEALDLIHNNKITVRFPYYSYSGAPGIDLVRTEPEFLRQLMLTAKISGQISDDALRAAASNVRFNDISNMLWSSINTPLIMLQNMMNKNQPDQALCLLSALKTENRQLELIVTNAVGDWPEAILEIYFDLIPPKKKVVSLWNFYEPCSVVDTSSLQSTENTRKLLKLYFAKGFRVDATPQHAMAWACQTGDYENVENHLHLVEANYLPYVEISRAWGHIEIRKLLTDAIDKQKEKNKEKSSVHKLS